VRFSREKIRSERGKNLTIFKKRKSIQEKMHRGSERGGRKPNVTIPRRKGLHPDREYHYKRGGGRGGAGDPGKKKLHGSKKLVFPYAYVAYKKRKKRIARKKSSAFKKRRWRNFRGGKKEIGSLSPSRNNLSPSG